MKKYFDFDDVNLIPNFSSVNSRSECNTYIKLGNRIFKLPVVPANMSSIINENIAIKLAENGYFYIMHRFNIDTLQFVSTMKEHGLFSSISIGVNEDSHSILNDLEIKNLIPDYITIDIAHGFSSKMIKTIKLIKKLFGNKTFIIAGNVANGEAAISLLANGADAVKIGIAPGEACLTHMETKFGTRGIQASILKEIKNDIENTLFLSNEEKLKAILICDGGIRNKGDIAVALTMGAHMVMSGGLLSAFLDSPGDIVLGDDNIQYKRYYGSASTYESCKKNRIEGTAILKPLKEKTILEGLVEVEEALQSAMSYGGGKDLSIFNKINYIVK